MSKSTFTKKDARAYEEWVTDALTRQLGKPGIVEEHRFKDGYDDPTGKTPVNHRCLTWVCPFSDGETEHTIHIILYCESVERGRIGSVARGLMCNSRTGTVKAYPFTLYDKIGHHKYQCHFHNHTPLEEVQRKVTAHLRPLGIDLNAARKRTRS